MGRRTLERLSIGFGGRIPSQGSAAELDVIARLARVDRVDPVGLRRNLVVSGINLLALKNARLQVGDALLEIVGPCQPWSLRRLR